MSNVSSGTSERRRLSVVEHIACSWPIALVVAGGALGGACGAAAYVINLKIMQSSRAPALRYALCMLTGVGAIIVWIAAIVALRALFPSVFT